MATMTIAPSHDWSRANQNLGLAHLALMSKVFLIHAALMERLSLPESQGREQYLAACGRQISHLYGRGRLRRDRRRFRDAGWHR